MSSSNNQNAAMKIFKIFRHRQTNRFTGGLFAGFFFPAMLVPGLIFQLSANPMLAAMENDSCVLTLVLHEKPADSARTSVFDHYHRYKQMIYNCESLLKIDMPSHSYPTNVDVENRQYAYAAAFPGVMEDPLSITQELLVEKYLLEKFGSPDRLTLEDCYNNFLSESPLEKKPAFELIYPVISNWALLSTPVVVNYCEELTSAQRIRDRNDLDQLGQPWYPGDLSLRSSLKECLVDNPDDGTCLVTGEDFNNYVFIRKVEKEIPQDSARLIILTDLLQTIFDSKLGKVHESFITSETTNQEYKNFENILLENAISPGTEEFIENKEKYLSTYNKYFSRFFKRKLNKKVHVLGSTDSSYIDSIYNLLTTSNYRYDKSRKQNVLSLTTSFPWLEITDETCLPEQFKQIIDTLKNQRMTRLRTPYGFFLVRINSVSAQSETSFFDAPAKLQWLINEERTRFQDKPDSVIAYEFYKAYSEFLYTYDTLDFVAWLISDIDSVSFKKMDPSDQTRKIDADTSTVSSMAVRSTELPEHVAQQLKLCIRPSMIRHGLIGPVFNNLGTWYFKIEKIYGNKKRIPFSSVKRSIQNKFEIIELPTEKFLESGSGKKIGDYFVKAHLYRSLSVQKIYAISDEEINVMIDKKKLNLSYDSKKKADKRLYEYGRSLLINTLAAKHQEDFFKWKNNLRIDYTLLKSEL